MISGALKGVADLLKSGQQLASGETYQTSSRKEGIRKNHTLKWEKTFWRGIVAVGENIGMALKLPVPTAMQWGPPLFSWVGKFFKGEE
jgi:hypothetical protein